MNSVLNKRILRDLRSNFGRYLALMFMIILGVYLVVSIVGSSELVLIGTEDAKSKNMVEDGQFSVFIPLTDSELDTLSDKGTVIEKMFSFDAESVNGSVLRVFKNRENIDLIMLDSGRLAGSINEAVIEKNYAAVNDIKTGDTISVSGTDIIITGIGSVPDYDAALKTFASPAVDSETFGVLFVTEDTYDKLLEAANKTESYTYAFRLGNETADELKERIQNLDFDYEKVEDEYYVSIAHEMSKTHYISFIAAVSPDRCQLVKLYPEGEAAARFRISGVRRIYFYCNRDGLYYYDVAR
jgi:putative ABC transport system permease protein